MVIGAFERFLRIGDEVEAAERLRVRILYMCCLAYMAILLVNFVYILVMHGRFTLPLYALVGISVGLVAVRWTRSKLFFGTFATLLPIYGIWSASHGSVAADASALMGGNLLSPTLPWLCLGAMMVAMVGSRVSIIIFGIAATILLRMLAAETNALMPSPELAIVTEMRVMQLLLATCLIAVTGYILSRQAYRAIDNLEKTAERAHQAETARADFLAKMSHEIRTPLHGILGLSDLLNRAQLPEEQKRPVQLIHVSANNLMEIIDEVLDMAKLEDGNLKIIAEPFDPRALIGDLCDLFAVKASEKGLWIGSDLPSSLPECLMGDAPHLRQILSNLTGNALKFTQDGGVRVGARLCGVQDGVAAIQFYIQDTGVGIAKDEQAAVFDRFSQTASAKTSQTKGTGLGLSISRELTEMMGGTLELQSEPGRGTVFHFTLALPIAETVSAQRVAKAEI